MNCPYGAAAGGAILVAFKKPPAMAAAMKSMARKSRPLPRKTVAKKRSSAAPIRSRNTPMNHKNAIPANGIMFKHQDQISGGIPIYIAPGNARPRTSKEDQSSTE